MGPQGPEHGLGGSPSGRRNPGYMWMSKGADLDDMSQLVPEPSLPKATKDYRTKDWPQSSFDHREEISEASLAEGFTFQRREPPRPGQFSNIPRHASLVMPAATQLCESFEHKVASPPKNKITVPLPRASPLDLPEICLPNKPAEIRSGIPEVSEESKPVCYNLKSVTRYLTYSRSPYFLFILAIQMLKIRHILEVARQRVPTKQTRVLGCYRLLNLRLRQQRVDIKRVRLPLTSKWLLLRIIAHIA